jgi:hypothetical protein
MIRLLTVFFTLSAYCLQGQPVTADSMDLKKIEWLCGEWTQNNGKEGKVSRERWLKTPEGLDGLSVTISGTDTLFVEKMKIISRNGVLFYVADVPSNKGSVYFRFTALHDLGFTCENPAHDFPKKITYSMEANVLVATISGDGKSIPYTFERR